MERTELDLQRGNGGFSLCGHVGGRGEEGENGARWTCPRDGVQGGKVKGTKLTSSCSTELGIQLGAQRDGRK